MLLKFIAASICFGLWSPLVAHATTDSLAILDLNRRLVNAIEQSDRVLASTATSNRQCFELGKLASSVSEVFQSSGLLFNPYGDPDLNSKLLPLNTANADGNKLPGYCSGQTGRFQQTVATIKSTLTKVRESLDAEVTEAIRNLYSEGK